MRGTGRRDVVKLPREKRSLKGATDLATRPQGSGNNAEDLATRTRLLVRSSLLTTEDDQRQFSSSLCLENGREKEIEAASFLP